MSPTTKAFRVLEALLQSSGPAQLADIARECSLPKPTVHRILQSLVADGYVGAGDAGAYERGPRLLAMAGTALLHHDQRASAGPIVRDLQRRTGCTVHFAALAGNEAVYIEKLEAARPYQMASRVGGRIPLHCTSIGKSILAALPPDSLEHYLATASLEGGTRASRATSADLFSELDEVRLQGFAIDNEENEHSVRCVGAAVHNSLGHVFGGVSVSGLTFQFTLNSARELGPTVADAATRLSRALGYDLHDHTDTAPGGSL